MSAGAFEYSRYASGSGLVYRIRVQPETLAMVIDGSTNAAAPDSIDGIGTIKTSAGNRAFGIKPRTVTVRFTSTLPTGYKAGTLITLPWMVADTWEELTNGDTGTYLGQAIELVSKKAENVR
jgi:hypothetical protein